MTLDPTGAGAAPFDEEELAMVARRATGKTIEPGSWAAAAPLAGVVNASSTGGVWRVTANDGSWSVIMKVLQHSAEGHRHWLSGAEPSDPMYWKREALVLTSDLFAGASGLRPPRCFGAFDGEGDVVRLWLEDVKGVPGAGWDVAGYRLASRHLGQMQGRFLAGRPLPREPWLSDGWLRGYVTRRERDLAVPMPPQLWQDPLVKLAFPENLSDAIAELWDDRHRTLDRLDASPQTLCHLDYWPKNLFQARTPGGLETIAIDWAYAGRGAIGEDVANLVADSLRDFFLLPTEHAEALTENVFEGYLEGLAEAGASVDRREARFAFCAAASLKYAWGFSDLFFLAMDKEAQVRVKERIPFGLNRFYIERGVIQRHLLRLAKEARTLAKELG